MTPESTHSGHLSNWHTLNTCNKRFIMKLNVYYHIWAPFDDYLIRFLIDEQLKRLQLHSLSDQANVHIGVVGKASKAIADYVKKIYGFKARIVRKEEKGWELHTLKLLYDDCKNDPNQYVMYMHTKGLSHYYNSTKNSVHLSTVNTWRHFMEFVCIDEWRDRVNDLQQYDAIGMNLMDKPFVHFSGNFWWTKGSHVIKLKDPFTDSDTAPVAGYRGIGPRHRAEAWVCSTSGRFMTRTQVNSSMYFSQQYGQYKIVTAQ